MEMLFHKIDGNADVTIYDVEGLNGKTVKEAVDVILAQNGWGVIYIRCVDFGNGRGDDPNYRIMSDYKNHQLVEADDIFSGMKLQDRESFMSRKVIGVRAEDTWGNRCDFDLRIASAYDGCSEHYY